MSTTSMRYERSSYPLPCDTVIYNETPLYFCYWYRDFGVHCHMALGPGVNQRIVQKKGITIRGLEYQTEEYVAAHRHVSWPNEPDF